MKKSLCTFTVLCIILFACKKEDENEINSSLIIGTWEMIEFAESQNQGFYDGGYPNGAKVITSSSNAISTPEEAGLLYWIITFLNDGIYTEDIEFIQGNSINHVGDFQINGTTMLMDDGEIELEILELTSSNLSINGIGLDTLTHYWDSNNDTVYFIEYDNTLVFEKVSVTDSLDSEIIQSNKESLLNKYLLNKFHK